MQATSCFFCNMSEIIDLTRPFTSANHRYLSNDIINLDTDDSYIELNSFTEKPCKNKKIKRKLSTRKKNETTESTGDLTYDKNTYRFGDCPICWEELSKKRLASTICGHVFCFTCLEQSLKVEKKCPTCRKSLKNKCSYHPLYLSSC